MQEKASNAMRNVELRSEVIEEGFGMKIADDSVDQKLILNFSERRNYCDLAACQRKLAMDNLSQVSTASRSRRIDGRRINFNC